MQDAVIWIWLCSLEFVGMEDKHSVSRKEGSGQEFQTYFLFDRVKNSCRRNKGGTVSQGEGKRSRCQGGWRDLTLWDPGDLEKILFSSVSRTEIC